MCPKNKWTRIHTLDTSCGNPPIYGSWLRVMTMLLIGSIQTDTYIHTDVHITLPIRKSQQHATFERRPDIHKSCETTNTLYKRPTHLYTSRRFPPETRPWMVDTSFDSPAHHIYVAECTYIHTCIVATAHQTVNHLKRKDGEKNTLFLSLLLC